MGLPKTRSLNSAKKIPNVNPAIIPQIVLIAVFIILLLIDCFLACPLVLDAARVKKLLFWRSPVLSATRVKDLQKPDFRDSLNPAVLFAVT